jgi:hypothetical protein
MARRSRQTFEEILVAVAPANARALEVKARTAGELARAYPYRARPFAAVEDRLLQQLWKLMSCLFRAAVPNARLMPSTKVRRSTMSNEAGENPSRAFPALPR